MGNTIFYDNMDEDMDIDSMDGNSSMSSKMNSENDEIVEDKL